MGNCLKKKSHVKSWGGDDQWEFLSSKPRKSVSLDPCSSSEIESRGREDKCKKVRFNSCVEVFGGYEDEELKVEVEEKDERIEQVKIRISKKQLEELLGKFELESVSVDQMMSRLVDEIHLKEHIQDYQK